jgi:hypothetical protein
MELVYCCEKKDIFRIFRYFISGLGAVYSQVDDGGRYGLGM